MPSSSQVLLFDDLSGNPARSISDILRQHAAGVRVGADSLSGTSIGARGEIEVWNNKFQTHYDGESLSDWGGRGLYILSTPLMGDMQTAEVVLGPSARSSAIGFYIGWNDLAFDADVLSGGIVLFNEADRPNDSPGTTMAFIGDYVFPLGWNGLQRQLSGSANYRSTISGRILSTVTDAAHRQPPAARRLRFYPIKA